MKESFYMTKMKYIGINAMFIFTSILLITSMCYCQDLRDDVDPKIQQIVIDYFENTTNLGPEGKIFVYCDFLGMSTKGDGIEVYARCVPWTFIVKDNQVLEGGGRSVTAVIYLEKTGSSFKVKDHKEPGDGSEYMPSIRRMFPKGYQNRLIRLDGSGIEAKMQENRIVNYFSAILSKDRFIDKPKLTILQDPHNHREPIYSYLNLKDSYRQVSFVLQTDMAKIPRTGARNHVLSPDSRFKAWQGIDPKGFHLYLEDKTERNIYEVVNRTKNWVRHIAWKGDHILVFDQDNGVNRFNPHRDWKSPDAIHGVHFEIDADKKEILWAVPFGELGFPEKKK
jgi:hypothetical protein